MREGTWPKMRQLRRGIRSSSRSQGTGDDLTEEQQNEWALQFLDAAVAVADEEDQPESEDDSQS
jgi:hypothetical protein